jgi:hypothetical protein
MCDRAPDDRSRRLIEIGREIRLWAAEESLRNPAAMLTLKSLASVLENKARRLTFCIVSTSSDGPHGSARGEAQPLLRAKAGPRAL